ncbi:hypothetical protein QCA50_000828 [Cerrena zonata]|uniref:Uncharacterized protein n=1 Tax=Cerrena zonata TaxID=2478898 RepID=A0AAW0GZN2_9APHY
MSGPLKAWINHTTPRARNIVRSILANSDAFGLTSQQIYDIAMTTPSSSDRTPSPLTHKLPKPVATGPPEPPNPDHPIRSMRYLKRFVLEDLAGRQEVVKVFVRRGAGGVDEHGNKLDLAKAKGMAEVSVMAGIQAKEAWLWRLIAGKNALPELLEKEDGPIPRVGPMVPDGVTLEEDDPDIEFDPFADDKGWTKENLKFVNVPVIDTRLPKYRLL